MKRFQRLGGKMLKRSADEADVGAVIAEFKLTDDLLDRMIKDFKAWKSAWEDILKYQADAAASLLYLYKPIEPTNAPEMTHMPAETPQRFFQKCTALEQVLANARADLAQEIGMITKNIIGPLEQVKLHTKALHKTLKHRENTKLDYERYVGKAEHARKKETKSAKDEMALAKHESDLAQGQIDYQMADDQVRQTFPPVVDAIVSLLPYMLASQVMLQTNLVGQLYTVLDAYCRQQGLPSPAPSDAEVIQSWEREFTSLRKELEGGLQTLARGKAVHMPMNLPDKDKSSTITGLGIRNKVMKRDSNGPSIPSKPDASYRQPSSTVAALPAVRDYEEEEIPPPKPARPGTTPSNGGLTPSNILVSRPRVPSYGAANPPSFDSRSTNPRSHYPTQPPAYGGDGQSSFGNVSPPSRYATPTNGTSPAASSVSLAPGDYFGGPQNRRTSAASLASSAASAVSAKKKPPPPVPVKRQASAPVQYVTALYDFEGQSGGDLAFREGDRIRVIKKTGSTDDWWEGEIHGRTGAFPANYVQL